MQAPADGREQMVRRLREQAVDCHELGSPFYGDLLERIASDVLADGPAAVVLAGHERDPGPSALALRLLAAVHRLVLEGRAPGLAAYYPSMGGMADAEHAWPLLRTLLGDQPDEVRRHLDPPPQTNEVGRSAVLVGGLLHVVARWPGPVRLFEIGASAGLNLRADRYRIGVADHSDVGPADSPVVLADAWSGTLPPRGASLDVVERVGCDVAPLDPLTADGRLRLTSYVWPDQTVRHDRLRGALAVAAEVPATMQTSNALDFVRRLQLAPGTTTVLWHSVMWQYLAAEEQTAVLAHLVELGGRATPQARFAHLTFEPRRRTPSSPHEMLIVLRIWPTGDERVLGTARGHGLPVIWE